MDDKLKSRIMKAAAPIKKAGRYGIYDNNDFPTKYYDISQYAHEAASFSPDIMSKIVKSVNRYRFLSAYSSIKKAKDPKEILKKLHACMEIASKRAEIAENAGKPDEAQMWRDYFQEFYSRAREMTNGIRQKQVDLKVMSQLRTISQKAQDAQFEGDEESYKNYIKEFMDIVSENEIDLSDGKINGERPDFPIPGRERLVWKRINPINPNPYVPDRVIDPFGDKLKDISSVGRIASLNNMGSGGKVSYGVPSQNQSIQDFLNEQIKNASWKPIGRITRSEAVSRLMQHPDFLETLANYGISYDISERAWKAGDNIISQGEIDQIAENFYKNLPQEDKDTLFKHEYDSKNALINSINPSLNKENWENIPSIFKPKQTPTVQEDQVVNEIDKQKKTDQTAKPGKENDPKEQVDYGEEDYDPWGLGP